MTCKVIVVAETESLLKVARKAAERLGPRLNSVRAVKAETRRFGDRIAKNPRPLRTEVRDVVGFFASMKLEPRRLEPIVIENGKPVLVTDQFILEDGEYWVGTPSEIENRQVEIVEKYAGEIAARAFLCEVMFLAIENADVRGILQGWSVDPRTFAVELSGDEDGSIAKRLPRWMKVKSGETPSD